MNWIDIDFGIIRFVWSPGPSHRKPSRGWPSISIGNVRIYPGFLSALQRSGTEVGSRNPVTIVLRRYMPATLYFE